MDLVNKVDKHTKNQVEAVQQEKKERVFVGRVLRRRGLKVFSFDLDKGVLEQVSEAEIRGALTAVMAIVGEQIKLKDRGKSAITINSPKTIFFEAHCLRTAKRRVDRWLAGEIPYLVNFKLIRDRNFNKVK